MTKIRVEVRRKPAPPALDPFECLACRQLIDRDPYTPDFNAPPICWACTWRGQPRLQTKQLPFSMWQPFRTAYALLQLLDQEIAHARQH
jgi:hypothetical protein